MEFNKTITFYLDQTEVTFADNTNPGAGTTAYNQFVAKKTIHAISNHGEMYLPFHAIRKALLAVEGVEKDITDDVCEGGGSGDCTCPDSLVGEFAMYDNYENHPITCGSTYHVKNDKQDYKVQLWTGIVDPHCGEAPFTVDVSNLGVPFEIKADDEYCQFYIEFPTSISIGNSTDVLITMNESGCKFSFTIVWDGADPK